jgi:predicted component of type VI protein secretion system
MSDMAQFVGRLDLSRLMARLRVEREPTTRSSLHRLLLEANNLAFNLGQLGGLQGEVIEGRHQIAVQIALVETLAANGQNATSAENVLSKLIDVQKTIEEHCQAIVEAMDRNHNTHNAASMNHATKMAMA